MPHEAHLIEPYTDTPVPGTPFTVYHQGDEEAPVFVDPDGALRLYGGPDWTVRLSGDTTGILPSARAGMRERIIAAVDDPGVVIWVADLKGAAAAAEREGNAT